MLDIGLFEDIMAIPKIEQPVAAPTGDHIALLWGSPPTLHIFDRASRTLTAVGDGERIPDIICWDPDGTNLFFQSIDENNIYATDINGDINQIQSFEQGHQLWDVSPDGCTLYVHTDETLLRYDIAEDEPTVILEDTPFFTAYGADPGGVSPDGKSIAYTVKSDAGANSYVATADGSDPQPLEIETSSGIALVTAWGPESTRLLVTDSPQYGHVGVFDLETESTTWFELDLPHEAPTHGVGFDEPVAFLPNGDGILTRRSIAWIGHPTVYDNNGASQVLTVPGDTPPFQNSISRGRFLDETTVLIHRETETRPGDLLAYDIETDRIELLFEAGYGNVASETLVAPRRISYETADGGLGEAMLYDSGQRPSPAVVEVYSPIRRSWQFFSRHIQYLLSEGYSVMKPLHPGDHLTPAAHANNAAAGQWLKSRPWIDEERVAVLGHSHGAHEVYMQLVRYPDIWSAGVAIAGMPNLLALVEDGTGPSILQDFLGDPLEHEDRWREQSPIEHIAGLGPQDSFPLLVVHPEEDMSGETEREFCDALVEEGWAEGQDFEYIELDQGHVEADSEERIERWGLIGEFLNRRLKNR